MTFQHSIVNNIVVSGAGTAQAGRVLCDTCSDIVAALEALAGIKLDHPSGIDAARKKRDKAIEYIKAGNADQADLSGAFNFTRTGQSDFWWNAEKHCREGCNCGF